MHSDDKKPYTDALRLSDSQRRELHSRLDRRSQAHGGGESRLEDRLPYTAAAGVMVTLHHPGGSVVNYLVQPRNLSRHGVGFLHGNFAHIGSCCQVYLQKLDRQHEPLNGTVVRCQHVEGRVHEIGVRFEHPVELDTFIADYSQPAGQTQESMELPKLSGRVLYVEESVSDRELLQFHLGNLGVETTSTSDGLEAMELAEQQHFDLIITGIWLPGMTGPELAEAIRANGYEGPVIALTADDSGKTREEALARGYAAIYLKPYTLEQMIEWLNQHLVPTETPTVDDECLLSTEWSNPQMRPLILDFIERMEAQVIQLAESLASGEGQLVIQKLSLELKGSAGGYGYPSVSEASSDLHRLSTEGAPQEALAAKCQELANLCRRAGQVRQEPR